MSENSEIASEASRLVRQWAGRRDSSDSVKGLIRRAARRLGFSYSRTRSLYYREARRIDAREIDRLRRAGKAEAANVLAELQAIVDRAEAILARRKNRAGAVDR